MRLYKQPLTSVTVRAPDKLTPQNIFDYVKRVCESRGGLFDFEKDMTVYGVMWEILDVTLPNKEQRLYVHMLLDDEGMTWATMALTTWRPESLFDNPEWERYIDDMSAS